MFKFAKNTAQRLRNLDLNEIPDDILVFDPLAVAAWAYRLEYDFIPIIGSPLTAD